MSDTQFQQQVLTELQKLNGRFDTLEGRFDNLEGRFGTLEGKVDTLATEFHEFKQRQEQFNQKLEKKTDALSADFHEFRDNQEQFNTAIWNLNNQAFQSINDIHQETVSPWKRRQSKMA